MIIPLYTGNGVVDVVGTAIVRFAFLSEKGKFSANAVIVRESTSDRQLAIWWDRHREPPGFVALWLDAPGPVVVDKG